MGISVSKPVPPPAPTPPIKTVGDSMPEKVIKKPR